MVEPLMGQEGIYDGALMGILQSCGKLQPFLDSVFCFLARRTDFYIIMQHERARMGFPPGVAEGMVMQAFKRYEILTRKKEAEIMREAETKRIEQMTKAPQCKAAIPPPPPPPPPAPEPEPQDELPITLPTPLRSQPKPSQPSEAKSPEAPAPKVSPSSAKVEPVEVKEKKTKAAAAFSLSSDTYNGAITEDYKWSQTITDVDIRVPVPKGTVAKHIRVNFRSDHLKVVLLKPERKVLIDGPLPHRVKVEESMWSVDKETSCILINLEKAKEIMWKCVLEGDKEIDLTSVDTTRDISEFDAEAQAAIQRATYDHHMKMLGRPTSSDQVSQQKAHDILKKAWNVEGSPFKGTPFDPSKVHIAGIW